MRISLGNWWRGFAMRLRPQEASAGAVAYPGARAALQPGSETSALAHLFAGLGRNVAAEQERWLPWCVVAFAAGIAAYFSLAAEPSATLALGAGGAGLLFAAGAPKSRGIGVRFVCVLIAAGGLGFAAAGEKKARSHTDEN